MFFYLLAPTCTTHWSCLDFKIRSARHVVWLGHKTEPILGLREQAKQHTHTHTKTIKTVTRARKVSYWGKERSQSTLITKGHPSKNPHTHTYLHKLALILTTLWGLTLNLLPLWHLDRQWWAVVALTRAQGLCRGDSLHHLAKTCFLLYPLAPAKEML